MEATCLLLWLQSYLSLIFFSFASIFFVFAALLLILRFRPWCNCEVCHAYLNSTWRSEFDNLCDWYAHLLRHSSTGTIHIHVLGNTITANPANVEHMLTTRFHNYPKGKPFSTILGDLLGRGIFNADGENWRFQRKLASLELGSVAVRSYAFNTVSAELRSRLLPLLAGSSAGGGAEVDLQDVFRRFSFDTICRISFGLDPGCLELSLPVSEFAAAFDAASRLSAWRGAAALPAVWKLKRWFNLGSERELRRAIGLVDALAAEVIRQRRKLGAAAAGHDLLSRFMDSVDDDKYLRDIVVSFLLAGRDTVAAALTSFFHLLASHPAVEAAILDEITRVTGGAGEAVASYDELRGMQYVHAALYESMRLFPPVQFDSKFSLDDDVLADGTFVRRGTRVTYHPYAMGRMETIWGAEWAEFRPERWLNDDGVFVPVSPYKYPVFQGGLRVCIGKEMAIMEMKAVVVAVVRGFEVDVAGGRRNLLPGSQPPLPGDYPLGFGSEGWEAHSSGAVQGDARVRPGHPGLGFMC